MRIINPIASLAILFSVSTTFACTFNGNENNAGTVNPTVGYQTINTTSGDYFIVDVNCGDTYNFNFCNNGGTASWDTQLTLLETNGSTELAVNDDYCGLRSNLSWQATFSGAVYILVTRFSCNFTSGQTGTLAYNVTTGTSSGNASFELTANNCFSASANITGDTGGTFSFNPAPVDGATINTSTGAISNGTSGATYSVDYRVNCVTTNESVTLSAVGNAAFSMGLVCGGATSDITGDTGGTFAFSPVPNDGAQIDAISGAVTNGTAGSTYTVAYTVCGSTTSQTFTVLDDDCWSLNGNAYYQNINGDDCIQLTSPINSQLGCAWSPSRISFGSNFSLSLDYYFGSNIDGADGNTFTFQPSASTACGIAGGQLGAGGIPNALAIEFDTYDNDYPMHVYDRLCDHIAIEIDGDHQNGTPAAGPVCAKSTSGNIDDGGIYEVEITWDALNTTLEVYFDGDLRLTYNNDLVNNVFGGQKSVYWGATAATGALNNQQYLCPNSIVILPVGLTTFTSECIDEDELFTWKTSTEHNASHFTLEYTYDGYVFYPETAVQAVGNSTTEQTYQARVSTQDQNTRYYRLKITDVDGSIDVSDLIASQQCRNTSEMVQSLMQESSMLTINVNEYCSAYMINMMGQNVTSEVMIQDSKSMPLSNLATGMYQLVITGITGKKEVHQVMIP